MVDTCDECRHYDECGIRMRAVREFYHRSECSKFRRKQMSDRIQVDVMVNGYAGTLADVSEETLIGMRNKSQPTVIPIKHGDYGRRTILGEGPRFFFRDEKSGDIKGYGEKGELVVDDANDRHMRGDYIATGNIFKDMQSGGVSPASECAP